MIQQGKRIRFFRDLQGYSQNYMAEKMGINQAAYSKIERGKTTLTIDKTRVIAEVLNVSIDNLINDNTINVQIHLKNNHLKMLLLDHLPDTTYQVLHEENLVLKEHINTLQKQIECHQKERQELLEVIELMKKSFLHKSA